MQKANPGRFDMLRDGYANGASPEHQVRQLVPLQPAMDVFGPENPAALQASVKAVLDMVPPGSSVATAKQTVRNNLHGTLTSQQMNILLDILSSASTRSAPSMFIKALQSPRVISNAIADDMAQYPKDYLSQEPIQQESVVPNTAVPQYIDIDRKQYADGGYVESDIDLSALDNMDMFDKHQLYYGLLAKQQLGEMYGDGGLEGYLTRVEHDHHHKVSRKEIKKQVALFNILSELFKDYDPLPSLVKHNEGIFR